MKWPEFLRQDRTWTVVSAVSSAIAAVAAFGAIYQARQIAQEDRLSKKPYLRLKTAELRPADDGYAFVFVFDNIGARPATELRERLVLVKPDLPSPLADLKSSTANEIAPGAEYLWQHAKVRVPENPGVHYVVFALSYRDPLAATRSAQLLVLQWPGATQGRVPIGLNLAQADEADRVVKQAEAAIGPLR